MPKYIGKYQKLQNTPQRTLPCILIPLSFLLVELFGFCFLLPEGESGQFPANYGFLWSLALGGIVFLLPGMAARIVYGVMYFFSAVYAGFQTGYYLLFSEMMWLSDFRYAAEGADYASVLLSYPLGWWLGIIGMILMGILILWKFPVWEHSFRKAILPILVIAGSAYGMEILPEMIFEEDEKIKYAVSDYGRSQSSQAVYENMFNTHRLYRLCGLHHTLAKDIYRNAIYPLTPSHAREQAAAENPCEDE